METNISKLQQQIDSVINYLSQYLPLANCHMVEFFTHNYWDVLLPQTLKDYLESIEFENSVDQFWRSRELLMGKLQILFILLHNITIYFGDCTFTQKKTHKNLSLTRH